MLEIRKRNECLMKFAYLTLCLASVILTSHRKRSLMFLVSIHHILGPTKNTEILTNYRLLIQLPERMQRDGCEKRTQKELHEAIFLDHTPVCPLSENLEVRDLAGGLAIFMSKIHRCNVMPSSKELDSALYNFRILFEKIEKSQGESKGQSLL